MKEESGAVPRRDEGHLVVRVCVGRDRRVCVCVRAEESGVCVVRWVHRAPVMEGERMGERCVCD